MSFTVDTVELDLPPLVAAFGRRLRDAGLPITPEREAAFARALTLTRPVSRRRLYFTARAALLSDASQRPAFDAVFAAVFGRAEPEPVEDESVDVLPEFIAGDAGGREEGRSELLVPTLASDEEVLRRRRFDELEAGELAALYRLMARLRVAPPARRSRRTRRGRHGERIDLRRTLRRSLRTGGVPIRLARRHRRIVRRRLVLLCDISGSMEPYARAYLQFLTSAMGASSKAEAFVFATRLTRVTRALRTRNPERALQRATQAAPDWSSGTRIADALKAFNDRHGRRGMARGAVIVILSDGWERGEPGSVAREMERLSRLAHRIVWVNPRVSARGFSPRAGGMAAALPFCDALVSGHSLEALEEVVAAIAGSSTVAQVPVADEEEPWASATPVPGSSVAMPSGYGPSRGRTTPGWSIG